MGQKYYEAKISCNVNKARVYNKSYKQSGKKPGVLITRQEKNKNQMDTDDLSNESYKAVMLEAEKFNHNLTIHFGVLASSCESEEVYLEKALKLVNEIKELDKYDLDDLFFGDRINISSLYKCLKQMELNIAQVKSIPKSKRHYEF